MCGPIDCRGSYCSTRYCYYYYQYFYRANHLIVVIIVIRIAFLSNDNI